MNLPTYKEALEITENSEAFYVQRGVIEGYVYAMFNYRLAMEKDFIDNKAWELRGLTYILDGETGDWVCYPMLTKFLNLNQGLTTQYDVVKDKEIESVEYKEDGSLISLLVLPNGKVVPKTKMSFDNDQTTMVKKWLLNTPSVEKAVKENSNSTFLFELVSPKNKIVLKYNKTELRLLQVRNTISGQYASSKMIWEHSLHMGINSADCFVKTLDELIELRETLENVEGWVVKFKDGQFIKIKTEWYVAAHGLMDDLSQEHKVIAMILEDTIDDVLGELENGSEEKVEIEEIMGLVDVYYNHRVDKAYALKELYLTTFNEVRKDFAIAHSKSPDFAVVMKNLTTDGIAGAIRDRMLIELSHLEKAREFLETLRGEDA